MLRLLSLIPAFRDLQNLCQMQARQIEELRHDAAEFNSLQESLSDCRIRESVLQDEAITLREQIEQLSTEKLILQDRLDSSLQDHDQMWSMIRESLDGERMALRTQVNHAVARAGGGVPYPDAHQMPASAVPQKREVGPVGRRSRLLYSEASAAHDRRFIQDMMTPPQVEEMPT
jgi:hypothetical protein